MNDQEKIKETKEKVEKEYKSIQKVWCPFLEDYVYFNVEGFEHLLFKSWNRTRAITEQYTRLRLFNLVPDIIRKSHTLQEYNETKLFVRQKINSRWEKRLKTVYYHVFIAIVKKIRLKIIIKEIEGSNKIFYSLYPSWWIIKGIAGEEKKKFYSGNLEED